MMRKENGVAAALVGVSLLLGTLLMVSTEAGAAGSSPFCKERMVRDFEKPLRSLPKLRPVPERPPFAPPSTSLSELGNAVLVLEDGETGRVGYGFSAPNSDRRFPLHWGVVGQAVQVSTEGEAIRPITRVRRRVGVVSLASLNNLSFRFEIPSDTGLYRVDLVFRDKDRKLLGRYGHYFRVMRPRISVELVADPSIVHPGEDIYHRLLNTGNVPVGYAAPFSVEQFDGTGWARYPWSTRWLRPLFRLPGGLAGRCQVFRVPEDMPPGVYRFRKGLRKPSLSLTTAPFEVAP
jgi:hypothetical protein